MTFTPLGISTTPAYPTAAIRSLAISTTPFGIGCAPVPSTIWPPTIARVMGMWFAGVSAGTTGIRNNPNQAMHSRDREEDDRNIVYIMLQYCSRRQVSQDLSCNT